MMMLTGEEVDAAYNKIVQQHNRLVEENTHYETMRAAECLAAGITPANLDEMVLHILTSVTRIPYKTILRNTPWIINAVQFGVLVGVELGKQVERVVVSADSDVPDFPPEPT